MNVLKNDADILKYLFELNKNGIQLVYSEDKLYSKTRKALEPSVIKEIKEVKEPLLNFYRKYQKSFFDLTYMQKAYLMGKEKEIVLNTVNATYYQEFEKENIDVKKLEESLNWIINQNEALRMVIFRGGKGIISENLPNYNIKSYKLETYEQRIKYREEMSHKTYNYGTWPMFDVCVGKSFEDKDILHMIYDCSILDAWSIDILTKMLFKKYSGENIEVQDYNYTDYLRDFNKHLIANKNLIEEADRYWTVKSENLFKPPELKTKQDISTVKSMTFKTVSYVFDKETTKKIKSIAMHNSVSFSNLIIGVYMCVLSKYSSNKDIAVNLTMFGKNINNKKALNLIGEFSNIALIEYDSKEKDIIKSSKNIQEQVIQALNYRLYDGINIIRKLKNGVECYPVVVTSMLGVDYQSIYKGFAEVYCISQTPQVILDHHIREIDGCLAISFDYIVELFSDSQIHRLLEEYKLMLEGLI